MPGETQVLRLLAAAAEKLAPGAAKDAAEALGKVIPGAERLLPEAGAQRAASAAASDLLRHEWLQTGAAAPDATNLVAAINPGRSRFANMSEAELTKFLDELERQPFTSLASQELPNSGVGARLFTFNMQRDALAEWKAMAGNPSPELQASNSWLQANMPNALKQPGLATRFAGGKTQFVDEGQWAVGPLNAPLETAGLRTCVGGVCVQGGRQMLFHAREMDHFTAVQEALSTAGIDLSQAQTTLLPGPNYGRTLQNILPAFLRDGKPIGSLNVIPFKGSEPAGFVAHNGKLFLP